MVPENNGIHKYMASARHKNGAEDYAKAAWYNNRLAEYLKTHT